MTDAENKDFNEKSGYDPASGSEPEKEGAGCSREVSAPDAAPQDNVPVPDSSFAAAQPENQGEWQSQAPAPEQEQWHSIPADSSGQSYDRQPYDEQPYNGQPYDGPSYNGQPYDGQPYDGQPYNGQPYNGQPYDGQPYNGQPYDGQPYNGQPYNGQPYNGQPYNGQPYNGQPYNGQPYNGQPYNGQSHNGQPYGRPPYYDRPQPRQKNKFATFSLICGITGLLSLCCCAFPLAIIMGVGAVCFAMISKKEAPISGPAIAGIILGIICILLGIGEFIYVMAFSQFMNDPENAALINEIYEQMEQQMR